MSANIFAESKKVSSHLPGYLFVACLFGTISIRPVLGLQAGQSFSVSVDLCRLCPRRAFRFAVVLSLARVTDSQLFCFIL